MASRRIVLLAVALLAVTVMSTYSFIVKIGIVPIHASCIFVYGGNVLINRCSVENITRLLAYCNGTLIISSQGSVNVSLVGAVGNIRIINGTLCINGTCLRLVKTFTENDILFKIGNIYVFKIGNTELVENVVNTTLIMMFRQSGPSSFPVVEIVSNSPMSVYCNETGQD